MNPAELAAKAGENIGTSEWVEMTQEKVNMFADATGDHQFIHVEEEAAKMTPFGGTIVHGFMTLSMIPYLGANSDMPKIDNVKMGVNYGGNKTRFIAPVRVGKRIRRDHDRDRGGGQAGPDLRMDHAVFRVRRPVRCESLRRQGPVSA